MQREISFEVWGGYEGQEESELWAAFPSWEEASAYKEEQEKPCGQLTLHISRKVYDVEEAED